MTDRKHTQLIDSTQIPGSDAELQLFVRDDTYTIRITDIPGDLMNSRSHSSEDSLGTLSCRRLQQVNSARVLIGGLGMGFTLAAALSCLDADARVVVAELVPGVVEWNRQQLGECAGHPLKDSRVTIRSEDVRNLIEAASNDFDAILLDVDNGPEALTHPHNDHLYSLTGLQQAHQALRSGGTLAVWSAAPSATFSRRLESAGFSVTEKQVRAHKGRGARHTIWLATRRA
jgi:spermidine synthase